jgi:hypothetical protein
MLKNNKRFTIQAIVVLGCIFLLYSIFFMRENKEAPRVQSALITQPADPAFRARFSLPAITIDSSMSYHRYRTISDSIDHALRQRNHEDLGDVESFGTAAIGVLRLGDKKEPHRLYMSLGGYSHGQHDRFFRHDRQSYLAAVQWDSGGTAGNPTRHGHYAVRPVPVLYSAADRELAIPINPLTYYIITFGLWAFLAACFFLGAYVLIGYPWQLLTAVAKGQAFRPRHGRMLRTIGITVACWTLLQALAPQIVHMIFSTVIPAEFTVGSPWKELEQRLPVFFLSALIFLFGRAFDKGLVIDDTMIKLEKDKIKLA